MSDKIFYGMSGIYDCPRVLSAARLGYSFAPKTPEDENRLKHYTRMEAVAADQIKDLGFDVREAGKCLSCESEFKNIRYGFHTEIKTEMYLIVGHMDRMIFYNGKLYPVEIKSAGKSTINKFANQQFKAFPKYAGQECCYLKATGTPGFYWMMDRDSGVNLKYIVNDFNNELNFPGFEKIELPITFEDIIDRLNTVEIDVAEGKLSSPMESDDCFFCSMKYSCAKEEEKKTVVLNEDYLLEASKEYLKGLNMEKKAKEIKAASSTILLNYAKTNHVDKFKTPKVSMSYRGMKTRIWLDESTIRKNAPADVVRMAERESEPYDDYSIRAVKKGDSNEES